MGKIIMAKILVEPISCIADCAESPSDMAFLDELNKRSPQQIIVDRFFKMLKNFGLLDEGKDYLLSRKTNYPFLNVLVDSDKLINTYPNLLECLCAHFNQEEFKTIEELFE